jgi:hypothetical protein
VDNNRKPFLLFFFSPAIYYCLFLSPKGQREQLNLTRTSQKKPLLLYPPHTPNVFFIIRNIQLGMGMMVHTYNPNTQVVKAEGSQVQGYPGQHSELKSA